MLGADYVALGGENLRPYPAFGAAGGFSLVISQAAPSDRSVRWRHPDLPMIGLPTRRDRADYRLTGRSIVAGSRSGTRTGAPPPIPSLPRAGACANPRRQPRSRQVLPECGGSPSIRRRRDVTVVCQLGGPSRLVRGRAGAPGPLAHSGRPGRSWRPTPTPPRVRERRRSRTRR